MTPSGTGRYLGNAERLGIEREKRTGRVLAELGIWPENAAVSLKAATDALLCVIPEEASAMTQTELFEKAGVITKTTGQRALNALLAEKQIQRIGKGVPGSPFRYFKQDA